MYSSSLYWFLYRRRTKFLILLMTIFIFTVFFYQNEPKPTAAKSHGEQREKRDILRESRTRINRDTYTTPEPCQGCPGENGQGVQLTV